MVPIADGADLAQVGQRDGLPSARVVRDRDEHDRDGLASALLDERLERGHVHVALERVDGRGLTALGDGQVHGFRPGELHVGAGGVEVGVVGHHHPRAGHHAEQDLLRRPPLVGGNDVTEREQLLDGLEEPIPAGAAGVRLVTALDAGPLLGAHGAGARIGQEVDEHVVGVEVEQVVARGLQGGLPLLDGGEPDGLDALDPEGLDDRVPAIHHVRIRGRAAGVGGPDCGIIRTIRWATDGGRRR